MTVLVRHDTGCKWSRLDDDAVVDERANILSGEIRPGHSDAAKRMSDGYNLHRAADARGWIAVALADGQVSDDVYETREEAIFWQRHDERWYFFAVLRAPSMSVCQAESLLRYRRIMNKIEAADRDAPGGGLEVIPELATEDREAQIRAVMSGQGMVALGHRRST